MARRKFSKEEVQQWQKEHNQTMFYINKNDSNLFVRRYYGLSGVGGTVNLAHPGAWIIIIVLVGLIVSINVFRKSIFG
ncbi:MAG: hypothetical protein WCP73_08160 [Eubacteriales bacterium]